MCVSNNKFDHVVNKFLGSRVRDDLIGNLNALLRGLDVVSALTTLGLKIVVHFQLLRNQVTNWRVRSLFACCGSRLFRRLMSRLFLLHGRAALLLSQCRLLWSRSCSFKWGWERMARCLLLCYWLCEHKLWMVIGWGHFTGQLLIQSLLVDLERTQILCKLLLKRHLLLLELRWIAIEDRKLLAPRQLLQLGVTVSGSCRIWQNLVASLVSIRRYLNLLLKGRRNLTSLLSSLLRLLHFLLHMLELLLVGVGGLWTARNWRISWHLLVHGHRFGWGSHRCMTRSWSNCHHLTHLTHLAHLAHLAHLRLLWLLFLLGHSVLLTTHLGRLRQSTDRCWLLLWAVGELLSVRVNRGSRRLELGGHRLSLLLLHLHLRQRR